MIGSEKDFITPQSRDEGTDPKSTGGPGGLSVQELLAAVEEGAVGRLIEEYYGGGDSSDGITRDYWPDTYWEGTVSGPSLGDVEAGDVKSSRQDVWDGYGYYSLDKDQQKLVREATDAHYKRPIDDASYYGNVLKTALARSAHSVEAGDPITVEQALRNIVSDGGIDGRNRGGGGGSGRSAPTPADPTSIRRIMDVTSSALIGRTISENEFNKFYKQYTNEFGSNPDVDPNQLAKEYARTDEDYQEYQVASKFSKSMSRVLRGIL